MTDILYNVILNKLITLVYYLIKFLTLIELSFGYILICFVGDLQINFLEGVSTLDSIISWYSSCNLGNP